MSRGQENQVVSQAQQAQEQQAQNAQTSYNLAQGDVANTANQAAEFASANPYKSGGEFETSQNKTLANTSDAAAQAAAQAMQGQAVRTGQNAGSAIAASQATEQANERNLSGQEAQQNAARIGNEAGYNEKATQMAEVPAQLETALSGQQGSEATGNLSVQQKAAEEPSFLDTLGNSFAAAAGKALGS